MEIQRADKYWFRNRYIGNKTIRKGEKLLLYIQDISWGKGVSQVLLECWLWSVSSPGWATQMSFICSYFINFSVWLLLNIFHNEKVKVTCVDIRLKYRNADYLDFIYLGLWIKSPT